MKRTAIIFTAIFLLAESAHAIGANVSIFIPERGTLSIEQGFSGKYTIVKNIFMVPFGIKYNKISGMMTQGIPEAVNPWFYADTIQLTLGVKANLPVGRFYITAEAMGIMNWNVYLDAIEGAIDRDLAASIPGAQFVSSSFEYDNKLGWGYCAGIGLGFRVERLTIDLIVSFMQAFSRVHISGDYRYVDIGGTVQTAHFDSPEDARLRLQGWKIVLGIDWAM